MAAARRPASLSRAAHAVGACARGGRGARLACIPPAPSQHGCAAAASSRADGLAGAGRDGCGLRRRTSMCWERHTGGK
eukprot:4890366-Prymnesium_polylepis.1